LRYGITYRQFSEIAKQAYIHEAFNETDDHGRRINASRVSVRTGISRKEVRRIVLGDGISNSIGADSILDHSGPPARVLHAWHSLPEYLRDDGSPLDLPVEGESPCFVDLARAEAGDVPPGAVRAELRRAGAIIELDDGRLRPVKRYFVPQDFDEKAITVLSGMLFPLAAGIDYNANPNRSSEGFIQRFAFSDHLDAAVAPIFRRWSRSQAIAFVESVNDWLADHESADINVDLEGRNLRVGVGVFYYEGPTAESVSGEWVTEKLHEDN
jgi:hypothetical protein